MNSKTLWCPYCIQFNVRGRYDVVVDEEGGLYVICDIHEDDCRGPFLYIANEELSSVLKEIGQSPCSSCGKDCDCEEECDGEPNVVLH